MRAALSAWIVAVVNVISKTSAQDQVKFSNVISTVRFHRGVLKIRQLRYVALLFMVIFLGVLVWGGTTKASDLPVVILVCLGFASVILLWGIFDVLTTQVSFAFRPTSDLLQIKARRRSFSLKYSGTAKGKLSLSVQKQMKDNSNRDRFAVVLTYEDKRCHIPFSLTGSFADKEEAKKELMSWSEKLFLT